jgi:hypothetical protein
MPSSSSPRSVLGTAHDGGRIPATSGHNACGGGAGNSEPSLGRIRTQAPFASSAAPRGRAGLSDRCSPRAPRQRGWCGASMPAPRSFQTLISRLAQERPEPLTKPATIRQTGSSTSFMIGDGFLTDQRPPPSVRARAAPVDRPIPASGPRPSHEGPPTLRSRTADVVVVVIEVVLDRDGDLLLRGRQRVAAGRAGVGDSGRRVASVRDGLCLQELVRGRDGGGDA